MKAEGTVEAPTRYTSRNVHLLSTEGKLVSGLWYLSCKTLSLMAKNYSKLSSVTSYHRSVPTLCPPLTCSFPVSPPHIPLFPHTTQKVWSKKYK
jgi:hypothetical protein